MEPTDEALMVAISGGNIGKLGILFERHHAALFQFFCRMIGNRTVAEDLVQDVFFRMLKYRRTFREGSRFTTWMFHIARNVRVDYLRKHRYAVETGSSPEHCGSAPAPADLVEQDQNHVLLKQALLELPGDKRELLVLARFQELPYSEIAELLGVDTGTVKVRVHRAIKDLRSIFLKLSNRQASWTVKNSKTSLRII
jgi:RNA polymerase sigma-70 factor (ECF subfamily)